MGDITSANSNITLTIPPLFTTPVQLQGFATDDIFDIPTIQSVETMMGVDGVLSGGKVFMPIPQSVMLQADSISADLFDEWDAAQTATEDTITASGVIILPGIRRKWTLTTGYLTNFTPLPAVKKLLQPRSFEITWESMVVAPST